MADELYDKALHSWLVLSGAIAILENEGLELSQIMHQTGKQEKPEHLPQHSGNAPK